MGETKPTLRSVNLPLALACIWHRRPRLDSAGRVHPLDHYAFSYETSVFYFFFLLKNTGSECVCVCVCEAENDDTMSVFCASVCVRA